MKKEKGLSLIEILITISLLMSITAFAVPGFSYLLVKTRVDSEIYRLTKLLQVARNQAINGQHPVTLCPLDLDNSCINDWNKALYVFQDLNNNRIYEPSLQEKLIATKEEVNHNDTLQYAKSRVAITYGPLGYLKGWGQNGTFKYCPYQHLELARGLVVATSGRFYSSFQTTKNKQKTRSNKYIHCN